MRIYQITGWDSSATPWCKLSGTMTGNLLPAVSITAPASDTTYPTTPASVTITASASDSDGTISKVDFYQGGTLLGTATSSPYTYVWNNVSAGSYYLTAVATDNNNGTTTSLPVPITVYATTPSTQINCGGSAVAPFVADSGYAGGSTASVSQTITTSNLVNPAPMAVYQSERDDPSTYTITGLIANGAYIVRLHFSENVWNAAGDRLFNVSINGTPVLNNYDIFADAGGQYIATVHDFATTASGSGKIVISTTNVLDHASLHGIEILTVSPCATPTFSPAPGAYLTGQTVTITSATSGATIRYTTDGSLPSETHGTLYSSPVLINCTTTMNVIAYKSGMADSTVAAATYTITGAGSWFLDTTTQGSWWSSGGGYVYGSSGYVLCAWNAEHGCRQLDRQLCAECDAQRQSNYCWATNVSDTRATINPATGTRNAACWYSNVGAGASFDCTVTLVNPTDGILHRLAVYCLDWTASGRTQTLDLLDPVTGHSKLNGGPVALTNFSNGVWVDFYFTGNVKLQATSTNNNSNAVVSALAFDNQCAAPAFNPAPGLYNTAQSVTITTTTSGATIRYTTDGSTPTRNRRHAL